VAAKRQPAPVTVGFNPVPAGVPTARFPANL
jgi:hypothetical protein